MARVLVTHPLPEGGTDPLDRAGHEIVAWPDQPPDPRRLAAAVADVDALVCVLSDRVDETVLRSGAAGRLRVVGTVSAGVDNVDLAAARRLGIAVCNTPGVLEQTTADLAFLLILAASRLASEAEADLRAGRWTGWGLTDHLGRDVHGAMLGLVGYGRVAREVARRAEGFGMEVLHHTRRNTGYPGYVGELDSLLSTVDVVSLHVPLDETTRRLVGRRELALMRPTSVLVNTSRGAVVDEEALADALGDGTIFAAGLDVYTNEPLVNPRLLEAPHTVLLPHIGSATAQTRLRMARLACEGVATVLAGGTPPNLVPV